MLVLAGGATASAQVVTNSADSGPGTLRSAIINAANGAVITFAPNLSGATNILTSGQLLIPTNLTIDASALPGGFKISGNTNSRVFEAASNTIVTLNSLTIQDGNVVGNGGGILINSGASLALTNCTLSGNSATSTALQGNGGGIYVNPGASLTLTNCTLSGNSANVSGKIRINSGGGGICFFGDNLTINGSTFTNNYVVNPYNADNYVSGGGICFFGGTLTVNDSTFSGDSAGPGAFGGGIEVDGGTNTINNSTFSGNSAIEGGGIDVEDGTLTINDSTFSGNFTFTSAVDGGGGICLFGGTLTVNASTFYSNSVSSDYMAGGGGIYSSGDTLTVNGSTFSGNSVAGSGYGPGGGGIYLDVGSTATITRSMFSGNSDFADYGGGISGWQAALTIIGSTFSGNFAATGGGIFCGQSTITGSTFSGNSASGSGGGIFNNGGTMTLNQCTLSGNSATGDPEHDGGGGIFNGGTLAITNTIVGGNSGSPGADIYTGFHVLTYGGSNLVQSVYNNHGYTGPAPLTNAPDLAPLGNYGGPTQTMPPLPGSPAIGAGSVAANTFSTDQRGYPRTQNGLIDIGAVELQSPAANPPVLENITVPAGGGAKRLQFTFTNAPAADFTVLTATNVSLALTNWTVLGEVQQVGPGQYQFTDPQAATNRVRFYRVRSP